MIIQQVKPKLLLYVGLAIGLSLVALSMIKEEIVTEEHEEILEEKIENLQEQLSNVPVIHNDDEDENEKDNTEQEPEGD